MRILLVYPCQLDPVGRPIKYRQAFLPPLSLATIAALTPPPHSVTILNDVVEDIDWNTSYDLVGITAMSSQAPRAYQLADAFRARRCTVIIGGVHATLLPEEAARHADAVVAGEAENTWKAALADREAGCLRPLYREAKQVRFDDLVVPRWEVANMGIYPRRLGSKLPLMPIFTTRGCPYGCRFCAVTRLMGSTYRTKPIANVLAEIDAVGAREYFFVDDNIACDPDYSRDLFGALASRKIAWMSQISTTVLRHPELVERAGRSGCCYLFVGVESLSRKSLAEARKSFNDIDQYEELIQLMRRNHIVPFLSFIFGFDEDGLDQFRLTLDFVRRYRIGFAVFWLLTPIPGTDLYADMLAHGRLLTRDWSLFDGTRSLFEPKLMSSRQLEDAYWGAYQELHSLGHITRCVLRNMITAQAPFQELCRNVFYQSLGHRKVRHREHPFSGGLGRV